MIYIAQASYDHSPPTVVGEGKRGKIAIASGPLKIIWIIIENKARNYRHLALRDQIRLEKFHQSYEYPLLKGN